MVATNRLFVKIENSDFKKGTRLWQLIHTFRKNMIS